MVLLDGNGKPKVFQHESSFLKKGKMMDYETLHTFATECIVKEYCNRKYEAVNTSNQEEETCDFVFKMASGRTICCKIVLTEESFPEVIAKTDFSSLFNYCRKVKGYPRLYTVAAWCFATPEGSKMINGGSFAFKIDSISLLDRDDDPVEQVVDNESLIKAFSVAWNTRDKTIFDGILSNHVHYSSSFVFDEIRGKIETIAYLGDIFNRIKVANGKSQLTLCRSLVSGELMLADLVKNGVFSFIFHDSRIIDIRLTPLERSQVEYISFPENSVESPADIQSKIRESPAIVKNEEETLIDISGSFPGSKEPSVDLSQNGSEQADNHTVPEDLPIPPVPIIKEQSIDAKTNKIAPNHIAVEVPETQVRTEKPTPHPVIERGVEGRISSSHAKDHQGIQNKGWIIGLSYLLGLVVSAFAVFLYMKGEIEWSREQIISQVDILKTNKHIAYINNESVSPRYKKEDQVPSGEFYERHKSFYSTGKTNSWYFQVVEQTTPTSFVYSVLSPHGVGFTSLTGSNIEQRFNELKRDIRDDIAKNSIISDNNSYLINSMLNASSKYHLIQRTKDNSKSTEWKFDNESDSYGLYFWEDQWKCEVSQNNSAIKKDSILYAGVAFLIVTLILTIVFMAIPSFRSRSKE